MAPTTVVAAPPKNFYYLAIDGTNAKDSAAFGILLEKSTGWKNLLSHFLKPAPELATRLVDPNHLFLPIHQVDRQGRKIAVVCPGGLNSEGMDAFWNKYPGDPSKSKRTWANTGDTTYGRHTACEESAEFMSELILNPIVEVVNKGASAEARIVKGTPASGAKTFAADLIYVSSHGWLGGFMRGELMLENPAAEPPQAQAEFFPDHPYFIVGEAASKGLGFHGPTWVVLAQCSTLNSATWSLWAKILAKSSPHVRGILGYEEASPNATVSCNIADTFFRKLRAGLPFVDAWREANSGVKWAAVVHKDARKDKLSQWGKFEKLASVDTTATVSNYLGYLRSVTGEKIFDVPAPFELQLVGYDRSTVVQPHNLHLIGSALIPQQNYSVKLKAPAGETIKSAAVDWIHIRPTHGHQFPCDTLFKSILVRGDAAKLEIDKTKRTKMLLTAKGTPTELVVDLFTRDGLRSTNLEAHHSYLWLRIDLVTDKKKYSHDFRTQGLSYYGH